jgi:hypothetical protein
VVIAIAIMVEHAFKLLRTMDQPNFIVTVLVLEIVPVTWPMPVNIVNMKQHHFA